MKTADEIANENRQAEEFLADQRKSSASSQPCANTDREIWREREGDYYADSIHVTLQGGIGINCGGTVYVKPVREWHKLAGGARSLRSETGITQDQRAADAESKDAGRDAGRAINAADTNPQGNPAAHPLPTPRTDANWFEAVKCGAADDEWQHVVTVDFARTLEREAAELRAHLNRLTGMKFSDRMHAALVSRAKTAERQLAEYRAAFPTCEEHAVKGGGARSGCLECAYIKINCALSRISYICGKPNEMEMSDYDVDYSESRVLKAVETLCNQLDEALKDAERLDHLETQRAYSVGKGFLWNTWRYDTDISIRQNIDAAIDAAKEKSNG